MYISQVAISFPETAILLVSYPVVPSTGEGSSSETQGQIKGARESLNGRENILLFFVPHFSARLDFPLSPLSAPGSPRMRWIRKALETRLTSSGAE